MLIPGACEYGSGLAEQQPGGSGTLGHLFSLWPLGGLACQVLKLVGSEVSLKINGKRLRTH